MGLKQNRRNTEKVQTLKEKQRDNPYLNITEDSLDDISDENEDSREESKEEESGTPKNKKKIGHGGLKQMFEQKKAEIKFK